MGYGDSTCKRNADTCMLKSIYHHHHYHHHLFVQTDNHIDMII